MDGNDTVRITTDGNNTVCISTDGNDTVCISADGNDTVCISTDGNVPGEKLEDQALLFSHSVTHDCVTYASEEAVLEVCVTISQGFICPTFVTNE